MEHLLDKLNEQLSLTEITEEIDALGIHYKIGCYKPETGFYVVSCSCGWRDHTGKSAGGAHALLRAHLNGHSNRRADDGD